MSSKKQQMAIRVASLYLKRANIQELVNSPLNRTQQLAFTNVARRNFQPFLNSYRDSQTQESIALMTEGINKYPGLHKEINEVYSEFHSHTMEIVSEIEKANSEGHQISPDYIKGLQEVEDLFNSSYKLFDASLMPLKKMSTDLHTKKFHNCDSTLAYLQGLAVDNKHILQNLLKVVQHLKGLKPFTEKQQEQPKKNWFQRMFKLATSTAIQRLEVTANDLLQIWVEDFFLYFGDGVKLRNACVFFSQPEVLKQGTLDLLETFPKLTHPTINHELKNLLLNIENTSPSDKNSWLLMGKQIDKVLRLVKAAWPS
jgi:hypothetical protein